MLAFLLACAGPDDLDTADTEVAPFAFTAVALNAESGGADAVDVADDTVLPITGEGLFAFVEIYNTGDAEIYVAAAADGPQDYRFVMGTTGYEDHLVLAWDDAVFELVSNEELHDINVGGTVRAPLVGQMRVRATGQEFLFVVNHLWRTESNSRHRQADLLNTWGAAQTLPVITMGDFNFDWNVDGSYHDEGYDLLTEGGVFEWLVPDPLIKTQCSASYDSVLDFAFVAGEAKQWGGTSEILRQEDDYCRGAREDNYSDHRPITASFAIPR